MSLAFWGAEYVDSIHEWAQPSRVLSISWLMSRETGRPIMLLSQSPNKGTQLLSAKETADYLGLPLSSIYSLVYKKRIPHTHLGRLLRFRREELDQLLEAKSVPALE
jgi:excisionase family DNA binding protein